VSRLAFLGTPQAAVPTLEALVAGGHEVVHVVTRPDRRRGRGGARSASPVKQAALELGLPVSDRLDDVMGTGAELGVVVAYGRLVPEGILEVLPMINVHFSLLPRWRGAAPVERAILAGDQVTGVCVMRLEVELDTGPVYSCESVPVGEVETADELRTRLAAVGARLTGELLAHGVSGLPDPVPQAGTPTYAEKIRADELELRWEMPAQELARRTRIGRAWTTWRGRRLRVLEVRPSPRHSSGDPPGTIVGEEVACGEGWLALVEVQPEGGRPMAAADWVRGARPSPGERLGT
jgi:methionyl-tRNA formyltransferase